MHLLGYGGAFILMWWCGVVHMLRCCGLGYIWWCGDSAVMGV